MYKKIKLKRGFTEIEELFNFCQSHNLYICGGYARYCASPSTHVFKADDVDLFPKNNDDYLIARQHLLDSGLHIKHENDVSISYKIPEDTNNIWHNTPKIQLIKPVREGAILTFGDIETILDNFDFSVTRAAIISPTEVLVDEFFEEDEEKKNIRILNIHCPISSMFRAFKYMKKGYHLKLIESIKLFIDWENRDNEYRVKIINYINKSETYDPSKPESERGGLTEEELMELYNLMKVD